MRNFVGITCGYCVEFLRTTCAQVCGFSATNFFQNITVHKLGVLCTSFKQVVLTFLHSYFRVFLSVLVKFIPGIHNPNKYNNKEIYFSFTIGVYI